MNACNKVTFSQMIQVLLLKRQRKEMCLYLLSFALYPSTFSISQRTPSVVHRDPGTSLSALCLSNHLTIMCPYTSLQHRLSVLDFDLQLWRKIKQNLEQKAWGLSTSLGTSLGNSALCLSNHLTKQNLEQKAWGLRLHIHYSASNV